VIVILLDFEEYAQYKRIPYSPEHVRKKFYEIQTKFNPYEGDRFLWISVNPEKKKFDWFHANNASNAFDFLIRRALWKNKGKYRRPYVPAIERKEGRFHFHGLIHLVDMRHGIQMDQVGDIAEDILLGLHEIGKVNHNSIDIDMISFSGTTRDYGIKLHYMVKSANRFHDPLKFKVYSKKEQEFYYDKYNA